MLRILNKFNDEEGRYHITKSTYHTIEVYSQNVDKCYNAMHYKKILISYPYLKLCLTEM